MSSIGVVDPYIDWIPHKFVEKYRRYYVNHELISRDDLKKLERALVRAFRYAIVRYYRARGYRLAKEVVERPERYGPTPAIIWLLILDDRNYIAMLGDSSIPKPGDAHESILLSEFEYRLKEKKFDPKYVCLLDMSHRYRWGDAQRFIYVRIEKISSEES